MARFTDHFTSIFNQWQSPTMIPVVLELLHEELNYLEGREANSVISPQNLPAYQALYQRWKHDKNLNSTQRDWVKQMGGCLQHIIKQTIFGESRNNAHSTESGVPSSIPSSRPG